MEAISCIPGASPIHLQDWRGAVKFIRCPTDFLLISHGHSGAMQRIEPGISRFPDAQLRICGLRPSAHPGMTAFVAGAKPLILPVVPTCRIPSGLPKHPNQWLPFIRPASTKRGASRSSRTLEAGCDGRKVSKRDLRADERSLCGRRSRMVLAPRRWRQVGDDASHHADDGGKKARFTEESAK